MLREDHLIPPPSRHNVHASTSPTQSHTTPTTPTTPPGGLITALCYIILGPAPFLYLWWLPRSGAWVVTLLALAAAGAGEALIAVGGGPRTDVRE